MPKNEYKNYEVIDPRGVSFPAGEMISMDKDQAKRRKNICKPVESEKDVYELTGKTMFKCGEKIGYAGDVTREMMSRLDPGEGQREKRTPTPVGPVDDESSSPDSAAKKAEAEAKKKAAAEAKAKQKAEAEAKKKAAAEAKAKQKAEAEAKKKAAAEAKAKQKAEAEAKKKADKKGKK